MLFENIISRCIGAGQADYILINFIQPPTITFIELQCHN